MIRTTTDDQMLHYSCTRVVMYHMTKLNKKFTADLEDSWRGSLQLSQQYNDRRNILSFPLPFFVRWVVLPDRSAAQDRWSWKKMESLFMDSIVFFSLPHFPSYCLFDIMPHYICLQHENEKERIENHWRISRVVEFSGLKVIFM